MVRYPPPPPDLEITPLLVTSGSDLWLSVQVYLFMDLAPLPKSDIWWLPLKLEAPTISKRAVHILLECFGVFLLHLQRLVFYWQMQLKHYLLATLLADGKDVFF